MEREIIWGWEEGGSEGGEGEHMRIGERLRRYWG